MCTGARTWPCEDRRDNCADLAQVLTRSQRHAEFVTCTVDISALDHSIDTLNPR